MGRRNKNTFSKALGHLKSRKIDEKLQMLSERPANSTMGYMTIDPTLPNPDFVSTQRGQESAQQEKIPDFTIGENPSNAASPTPESAPPAPNPTTSERYLPKLSAGFDGGPG